MGKARPRFGLEGRSTGEWGAEGQKWLQGAWLPSGEELATTQAQNDTPLEFLKNNQKMYSSG